MKKLLICLALLCLTACIPVDDFGAYWDKGTVDTALVGTWKNVKPKKDDVGPARLTVRNGAYRITSMAKKDAKDKPLFAKTLTAGSYTFFMASSDENGKTERDLVRYSLKDGRLTEYTLEVKPVETWLKWRHPQVRNFEAVACKPKCLFEQVKIRTLTDDVVRILSEIPDTAEYWQPTEEWRKVK